MEKLVETENDVKSAMTSHENCNRNLESQGTALTQLKQELEKSKNDNLAIKNAMENTRESANQLEDEKQNLMNQNNNLQDQLSAKNQLIEQLQQDKEKAEREVVAAKSALSSQIEKVEEIKKTIIEEYQQKESEKDTVYDENDQLVEDIVVPEETPEEENVAEDLQPLEDDEDEGLQGEDKDDLNESNLEESESTTTETFGAPSNGESSKPTTIQTTTQDGIVVNADLIRSEDSSSFISSLNDGETGNIASNVK